ncbi:tRNA lysidine(34) synthetase TilS [Jeotgalibacillus haloalkalitolerans]|uniref:tRNA(Ile)-lysidine synthase n=1 Tax=Jeotgalibacillus haloalkalitolerans TaxID=3104292 RepID=A0ABU5KSM5_9BACL|nr:tRNA lysidine(34) synthetase TilS [Jeotgalibacillus sp. HH7-29]MDZ5713806.1 tRNA lysidine(34) synthetase TilS [Jeotgalibacillus sp. HH7-29]
MSDFRLKVKAYCEKHEMVSSGDKVLIGVSGGPDSLALLHFFRENRPDLKVEAVHVDHGLRGSSAADAAYVKAYCKLHQIPFHLLLADVKGRMEQTGEGVQEAARKVRYAYFEELMEETGADVVMIGQHADDQVETILFRLMRGTSMRGAAGIMPVRPFAEGKMVRPFLSVTKSEIEQYCEQHDLEPRRDPTNESDAYTRNRLRRHVIPLLKKENPLLHEAFERFSEELGEDNAWLEQEAVKALEDVCVTKSSERFHLSVEKFRTYGLPLQRRMIHLILNYLYAKVPTSLSSAHTRAILDLLKQAHPSGDLHLPESLTVTRSYQDGYFHFQRKTDDAAYSYLIDKEQLIELPDRHMLDVQAGEIVPDKPYYDLYYVSESFMPLTVRSRRDGDKIRLPDGKGSKKIKDVFIEKKVPLSQRNRHPIVTAADGSVLWIPGLRKAPSDGKPAAYTLIYY